MVLVLRLCFPKMAFRILLQNSNEIEKIREELSEKMSAVKRLQLELNRREDEGAAGVVEKLKRSIATLEKENASLKVGNILLLNYKHNYLFITVFPTLGCPIC